MFLHIVFEKPGTCVLLRRDLLFAMSLGKRFLFLCNLDVPTSVNTTESFEIMKYYKFNANLSNPFPWIHVLGQQ